MNKYKLKNLLQIKNGKDYKKLNKGGFPVYGTGGIMTYVDEYLYDGESILLPRKGTLDNIMFVSGKFWTVDTIYWTKINEKIVYPKYLYFYLSLLDLSSRDSGSALPSMTYDSYYDLDIYLPSMDEQIILAKKMFSIVNKIDNDYAIAKKIDEIIRSLYDRWFLQLDFPDAKGNPYKASGNELIYNKIIKRDIPSDWEVKNVKDCICHINTGLNPRDNFVLNDGGNIKYVTVKNLTQDGMLDLSSCDYISKESKEIINVRSQIKENDILFASIAPLGRCYLIRETPEDWEINESVFSIRVNDLVTSEYMYLFFMSDYFIRKAEHSSTGSIFSGIRISVLEEMKVVVPPKKLLLDFNKCINPFLNKKSEVEKEIRELNSLKSFLLPLIMNKKVGIENEKNS